jgi:arylsulfatase A-like enzyme
MHFPAILKPEVADKTGQDLYADGMVEHDGHVGQLLKLLDDLGVADNTVALWTSDNGPMFMNWPDGGISPYFREKGTNWEGTFRVPAVVRWPGTIKPGTELNGIASHHDWFQTFHAAASGDAGVGDKLLKGTRIGGKKYTVHLDGFNLLPWLSGKEQERRARTSCTSATT